MGWGKTNLGVDQELVFAKLLNLERVGFPVQLCDIAPRLPLRHLQQLPPKLSIPVHCSPPHRKTLLVRPAEWPVHLLDLLLRLGVRSNVRFWPGPEPVVGHDPCVVYLAIVAAPCQRPRARCRVVIDEELELDVGDFGWVRGGQKGAMNLV